MVARGPLSAFALALASACALGEATDVSPRAFEIHRVQIEHEADHNVLLGFDRDDEQISASLLFVDDSTGTVQIEHEGEWLTVTTSPLEGGVMLTYDRGPWQLRWNPDSGEELLLEPEAAERWNGITLAWRTVLMDRDRLANEVFVAINDGVVSPPPEAESAEWDRVCGTVVQWQCGALPVTVTLACRVAGTAYCESVEGRR